MELATEASPLSPRRPERSAIGIDSPPQYGALDGWNMRRIQQLKDESTPEAAPSPWLYPGTPKITLSEVPAPTQRRKRTKFFATFRVWGWEILAVQISTMALIAITVTGRTINGSRTADGIIFAGFLLSINTLFAVLSTLQRSMMLYALAEVIGNLKWEWFSKPRPLIHMEHFDLASRGVVGSFIFLFNRKAVSVVHLCALVFTLSWAVGPFVQQSLRTTSCSTMSKNSAFLPITHFAPMTGTTEVGKKFRDLTPAMKAAFIEATAFPKGKNSPINPDCSSGRCIFKAFQDYKGRNFTHSSIGLCSKCIDSTALVRQLNRMDPDTNETIPMLAVPEIPQVAIRYNVTMFDKQTNLQLLSTSDVANFDWNPSFFGPDFLTKAAAGSQENLYSFAAGNMSIFTLTRSPCKGNATDGYRCPHKNLHPSITILTEDVDIVHLSCTFYPCLKNYFALVREGDLVEKIVSEELAEANSFEPSPEVDFGDGPLFNWTGVQNPCILERQRSQTIDVTKQELVQSLPPSTQLAKVSYHGANITVPTACVYKMPSIYLESLFEFIYNQRTLANNCSWTGNFGNVDTVYSNEKWWQCSFYQEQNASVTSLSRHVDGIATAMTNQMRLIGRAAEPRGNERGWVVGDSLVPGVCNFFEWGWMLYPGLLLAATATLLSVAIAKGSVEQRREVWKSSLLPLLFYSPAADGPRPSMSLVEMRGRAGRAIVSFDPDSSYCGFSKPREQFLERTVSNRSVLARLKR